MDTIKGDLIQLALGGQFDVIVHGCNCFNTMGAGIAKQIKKHFREAYLIDQKTFEGDMDKMGKYTLATVSIGGKDLNIVNGYTQYYSGGTGVHVNYGAIRNLFRLIRKNFPGKTIGFPKIGAGLAGGDWNRISKIITEELHGANFTLVEYSKT